jgi:hypothetical protein
MQIFGAAPNGQVDEKVFTTKTIRYKEEDV